MESSGSVYSLESPRTQRSHTSTAVRKEPLGLPTYALAILITSYFYCLPLGRYSLGGISTDFRIYDFALLFFVAFIAMRKRAAIRALTADRASFHRWCFFLLLLVWASLIMTYATGESFRILLAVLRSYRFTGFLLIAVFIVAIANTPQRWRFLLAVLYANIGIQALLACGQAVGVIPHLWPEYWASAYWKSGEAVPVGTLSPHHKHIGVVMMLGIAMSVAYMSVAPRVSQKVVQLVPIAAMLMVVFASGARTALLGVAAYFLAYLYVHRARAIPTLAFIGFSLIVLYVYSPTSLTSPLESEFDERVTARVEKLGIEGLTGDRMAIYKNDIPYALENNPFILITGAGFQNIQTATAGATGAHNNYLQALLELGILGFLVYMRFLYAILRRLSLAARKARNKWEEAFAKDVWAVFIGILATMMVGETLWAQYSMFTLAGQIMTLVGLACCPLTWNLKKEREQRLQNGDDSYVRGDNRESLHSGVQRDGVRTRTPAGL